MTTQTRPQILLRFENGGVGAGPGNEVDGEMLTL